MIVLDKDLHRAAATMQLENLLTVWNKRIATAELSIKNARAAGDLDKILRVAIKLGAIKVATSELEAILHPEYHEMITNECAVEVKSAPIEV